MLPRLPLAVYYDHGPNEPTVRYAGQWAYERTGYDAEPSCYHRLMYDLDAIGVRILAEYVAGHDDGSRYVVVHRIAYGGVTGWLTVRGVRDDRGERLQAVTEPVRGSLRAQTDMWTDGQTYMQSLTTPTTMDHR